MSNYGTPERAHGLLAEYYDQLPGELATDDTNALLGAVLLELRTDRLAGDGPQNLGLFSRRRDQSGSRGFDADAQATYYAGEVTLSPGETYLYQVGGPPSSEDGAEIDFLVREVDLRAGGAINVAFADPSRGKNTVSYASADLPVAGLSVRTTLVWVQNPPSAGGDVTVKVDMWGDA